MKNVVISFETAKLAKQKGLVAGIESYGCYCIGYEDKVAAVPNDRISKTLRSTVKGQFHLALAPTQSLLQKWLREIHRIDIVIRFSEFSRTYGYDIFTIENGETIRNNHIISHINSYEQSLEIALKEALKLIKS